MFCEEKKSKCPKKNFQSVKKGKKKNVSVGFRMFGKKRMEIERKVPEKKVKILLSSCSLVGRKGFRCSGGEKVKVKKNVWVVGYPVSWVPCCKTWLKKNGR